jgi:hypothetical protein
MTCSEERSSRRMYSISVSETTRREKSGDSAHLESREICIMSASQQRLRRRESLALKSFTPKADSDICVFPASLFPTAFQSLKSPVRKVVPLTYREAVDFLDGRRRREKLAEAFGQTPQRWKVMEGGGLQAEPTSAAPKPPAPDIVDLGAPTGAGP